MLDTIFVLTVLGYFAVSALWYVNLLHKLRIPRFVLLLLSCLVIVLHSELLHIWIDTAQGQNLSWPNMLSLGLWLITLLLVLLSFFRRADILLISIMPLTAVSAILMWCFTDASVVRTGSHPDDLFHILLGVLTFAVLCVAGLQAVALAIKERMLRHHYRGIFSRHLPPLDSMEVSLFHSILIGFVLLTLILITSIYSFYSLLWMYPVLWHKTVLTLVIWAIFAVLLIGRYAFGWRGRKIIYTTVCAAWLLIIIYFGSQWVLHLAG